MQMQSCFRWTFSLMLVAVTAQSLPAQVAQEGPAIKVMSFNIRYGSANDGENHWEKRRELVVGTIVEFGPDLLGVQEALRFQTEYLSEQLSGYEFWGRSRETEATEGEYCGIYFRKARFERIDAGHFWLSETPIVAGSKSWDSSLPRMASWVKLQDRSDASRVFIFANTHFDHRGPEARSKSAETIRQQLVDQHATSPIVLVGDFNSTETQQPYQTLVGIGDENARPLIDSYRAVFATPSADENSFSAWTGQRRGQRIDWILHSREFTTTTAAINYSQVNGRYPSDHYPVQATLHWKPSVASQSNQQKPTMKVKRCEDFDVTGRGDAAAWHDVPWTPLNKRGQGHHDYAARVRMLYSDRGVYVNFDGTDAILTATMQDDFLDLWNEDVYECFFWPDEQQTIYFEYEISPLGFELPILVPNVEGKFLGWRPWHYEGDRKIVKKVSATDGKNVSMASVQGWRAEVFIPFALLKPLKNIAPQSGTTWRANFYRVDYDNQQSTSWDWARVGPSFHEITGFGTLVFE